MAYIIFHYSRLDSWIRASDEPYITGNIVSVYDDGKIITENENSLEQKVNKKIICEDLYVTNKISKIIDDNKIASRIVRNFFEKSHANQAAFCSLSHSIFCSRRVSALM